MNFFHLHVIVNCFYDYRRTSWWEKRSLGSLPWWGRVASRELRLSGELTNACVLDPSSLELIPSPVNIQARPACFDCLFQAASVLQIVSDLVGAEQGEIDCKSGGNVNAVEARCGQIDCRMCLCQDERRPSQKRRSGAAKEETKQHKNWNHERWKALMWGLRRRIPESCGFIHWIFPQRLLLLDIHHGKIMVSDWIWPCILGLVLFFIYDIIILIHECEQDTHMNNEWLIMVKAGSRY